MSVALLDDYDVALDRAIQLHARVEMDTAEDRDLHQKALVALRTHQAALRLARAAEDSE